MITHLVVILKKKTRPHRFKNCYGKIGEHGELIITENPSPGESGVTMGIAVFAAGTWSELWDGLDDYDDSVPRIDSEHQSLPDISIAVEPFSTVCFGALNIQNNGPEPVYFWTRPRH
jgi:hypothetical protein